MEAQAEDLAGRNPSADSAAGARDADLNRQAPQQGPTGLTSHDNSSETWNPTSSIKSPATETATPAEDLSSLTLVEEKPATMVQQALEYLGRVFQELKSK